MDGNVDQLQEMRRLLYIGLGGGGLNVFFVNHRRTFEFSRAEVCPDHLGPIENVFDFTRQQEFSAFEHNDVVR